MARDSEDDAYMARTERDYARGVYGPTTLSGWTVVIALIDRAGNRLNSRPYYVTADTEDAAIVRAWGRAEREYGARYLAPYPVSVNGVPVDPETNWLRVRSDVEDSEAA
jgi:hypothetical protein